MNADTRLDWENRFIEATHRFPPGRDIPAAMGNEPDREASTEELAWWIVSQQQAEIDRLRAVMDAAEAFLTQPPEGMNDDEPFNQYVTAGERRMLNKVYQDAVEAVKVTYTPSAEACEKMEKNCEGLRRSQKSKVVFHGPLPKYRAAEAKEKEKQ